MSCYKKAALPGRRWSFFFFPCSSPLPGDDTRVDIAAMADQAHDKKSDGGPKVMFDEVCWPGPVVITGPMPKNVEDDDDKSNGEGPSNRLDDDTLPDFEVVPGSPLDTYLSDGNLQPVQKLTAVAVDSPVASELDQLERFPTTQSRARDSLELNHRRLSRSSSAVSPFTEVEGKKPRPEIHPFGVPSTIHHAVRTSHALNVIQPYPNVSKTKLKRAHTAPDTLGPRANPLLNRPLEPVTGQYVVVSDTVVAIYAPAVPRPKSGAKAAEVLRYFNPVAVVARLAGKDKTKDAGAAAPEQSGGGILKHQKFKKKDKGKGKAVEFVDPGEPSRSNDNRGFDGVSSAEVGNTTAQHSVVEGGQGQGNAGEVASAAQSAPQDHRVASDPPVGASHEARDGKQQADNGLKSIRRNVRKVVGQHLKPHALFKAGAEKAN